MIGLAKRGQCQTAVTTFAGHCSLVMAFLGK
ncbi:hypothetical protein PE36_18950 [Moritella sp. PE36]|nr:hypothetical protein PE36_18950 [Moritella sp. PE36]